MTTKQIDYCIELARTLNFSRAAENMFVSQPTFSYQIKLLEDEIGFAIFERSGQFAWIPFDCREQFSCVLCTHKEDVRPALQAFLDTLKTLYRQAVAFPL